MPYARSTAGPFAAIDLIADFRHQLEGCRLRPDEVCLILTDTLYDPVAATACLAAALDLGAEAFVVTVPATRPFAGAALAATFANAALVVALTPHLVHYDPHLRAALDRGARALMAVQPFHVARRLTYAPAVVARTPGFRGRGALPAANQGPVTDVGAALREVGDFQCAGVVEGFAGHPDCDTGTHEARKAVRGLRAVPRLARLSAPDILDPYHPLPSVPTNVEVAPCP